MSEVSYSCPVELTLKVIWGRWNVLISWHLKDLILERIDTNSDSGSGNGNRNLRNRC